MLETISLFGQVLQNPIFDMAVSKFEERRKYEAMKLKTYEHQMCTARSQIESLEKEVEVLCHQNQQYQSLKEMMGSFQSADSGNAPYGSTPGGYLNSTTDQQTTVKKTRFGFAHQSNQKVTDSIQFNPQLKSQLYNFHNKKAPSPGIISKALKEESSISLLNIPKVSKMSPLHKVNIPYVLPSNNQSVSQNKEFNVTAFSLVSGIGAPAIKVHEVNPETESAEKCNTGRYSSRQGTGESGGAGYAQAKN